MGELRSCTEACPVLITHEFIALQARNEIATDLLLLNSPDLAEMLLFGELETQTDILDLSETDLKPPPLSGDIPSRLEPYLTQSRLKTHASGVYARLIGQRGIEAGPFYASIELAQERLIIAEKVGKLLSGGCVDGVGEFRSGVIRGRVYQTCGIDDPDKYLVRLGVINIMNKLFWIEHHKGKRPNPMDYGL